MEGRREGTSAFEELALDIKKDVKLSFFNTFKIGGPADFGAFPCSSEELLALIQSATKIGIPWFLLGGGSNVLIHDEGYRGLVIFTKALNSIKVSNEIIWAQAGVSLNTLLGVCEELGLSGLEPLAGIPGTVGGAVIINAGSYGRSIGELVEEIEMVKDGKSYKLPVNEIEFKYRGSSIRNDVVLSAKFRLFSSDKAKVKKEKEKYLKLRRKTQPLNMPSAGCIFKNPPDIPAWKLIDKAGLRGLRIGGAQISQKHANFIVNVNEAKASEVIEIIQLVKKRVKELFDISLEEEIVYAGAFKGHENSPINRGTFQ